MSDKERRVLVPLAQPRSLVTCIRPRRCARATTLRQPTSTALRVRGHLQDYLHHPLQVSLITFANNCIVAYLKDDQYGATRRNAHRHGEPLYSHHQSRMSGPLPLIAEAMSNNLLLGTRVPH